jgi:cell wall-associated NlpC family hydrolase
MSHRILELAQQKSTKTQAGNKPTWTEQEVQEIIVHSRGWMNVKFRHQGRSKYGIDCIGLFSEVAKEIGRDIPIPSNYTHHPDQQFLLSEMCRLFDKITKAEMSIGDLVLMRFMDDNKRIPCRHVAMITNLGVLHSSAQFKKVTEHGLDEEWMEKIEHVFRMRRAA